MATIVSGLGANGFTTSSVVTASNLNTHLTSAVITNLDNTNLASNANIAFTQLASIPQNSVVGKLGGNNTTIPIVGAGGLFVNDDSLGTSDTHGATQGNIKAYVDAITHKTSLFVYEDTGTTTLGTSSFTTCPLTQKYNDISGVSISSHIITLPIGVYNVEGTANIALTNNNSHRGAFHFIAKSDDTNLFRGNDVATYNDYSNKSTRQAVIMGRITVTGSPMDIKWILKASGGSCDLGRNLDGASLVPHAYLKITRLGI